jgi:hypothetical protein
MPPFTDYVNNKYLNQDPVPGSDEAVALNAFRDSTLKDAGWTDESRNWAQSVPLTMQDDLPYSGSYLPRTDAVDIRRYPGEQRDADYGQTVEHEMMHAWDENHLYQPSQQDYDTVLNQDLHNPISWLKGLGDITWAGRGKSLPWGTPAVPDPSHYSQSLFSKGFGPGDLPDWYRNTYLGQYKT